MLSRLFILINEFQIFGYCLLFDVVFGLPT